MSELATEVSHPDQLIRRSQLYRWHLQAGAEYDEHNNTGLVERYSGNDQEHELAQRLGLTDLSTLPRTGFKGPGAPTWVGQQGPQLPGNPNRASLHTDGSLLARLSQEELLVLSDLQLNTSLVSELQQNWSLDSAEGVYLLPRADSHCWFALTGRYAAETFSKVCGVDLRDQKFGPGDIAQTSLARVNAIIIRNDLGTTPCFYILSDVSSAEFLWTCLLDAMLEFSGGAVGMAALRRLAEYRSAE
jgi:sarcosine oxidase subunit gamma